MQPRLDESSEPWGAFRVLFRALWNFEFSLLKVISYKRTKSEEDRAKRIEKTFNPGFLCIFGGGEKGGE